MFAQDNAETYFATALPPGFDFSMDVDTIKAGVNYRFGWAGPVVAKY